MPSWVDGRRRLALALAGLVSGLCVLEMGLRLGDPVPAWRQELVPQQVSELDIHRLSGDDELLYELIPNLELERQGPFGPYRLSTNARGFRGAELRSSPTRRIMVLGASNTFGPGVGDDQTWPALAQHALGEDYEVLNLGVSGYMTRQKVAWGRLHLDLKPDLIVLQVYNTGRRFLLHGTTEEAFSRWPGLWSEFFLGTGGALWNLASWRTAVLGWNRANQQEVAEALYPATVEADRAAVQSLISELGVPLVMVIPAAGGGLDGVGLPTIDLSAMNPPDREIHPDVEGHRWAAERVAAGLLPWLEPAVQGCGWELEQVRAAWPEGQVVKRRVEGADSSWRVLSTEPLGATIRDAEGQSWFQPWARLAHPAWCGQGEPSEHPEHPEWACRSGEAWRICWSQEHPGVAEWKERPGATERLIAFGVDPP